MSKFQEIIQKYQLKPHPEGGYFREVYRSEQNVNSEITEERRNAVTHIYFLLEKGQFSRFHRVLHDEIWNFYEGSPLKLIEYDGYSIDEVVIGQENNEYVRVIKGGVFQAAESTGEYSLVGCSVAPGFDFKDFSFLDSEPEMIKYLNQEFSEYKRLI
jgi:hypothetical protein